MVHRCTGKINPGPSVSMFKGDKWKHYDHLDSDWAAGLLAPPGILSRRSRARGAGSFRRSARTILAFAIAIQKSAQEHREIYIDELSSPKALNIVERRLPKISPTWSSENGHLTRTENESAFTLE